MKYNSKVYAVEAHKPAKLCAIHGYGLELLLTDMLMTRGAGIVCISIEPTALIKSQPD